MLTGGFPCQPYSQAGKRLGKEDERHLWPEMLRAIREIQPRWVVGENVRGLITWNGGLVFDEVQADLEAEGYEVLPFLLPASGVNAPHERYRIWFVAYADNTGDNTRKCGNIGNRTKDSTERKHTQHEFSGQSLQGIDSNTRLQRQEERQEQSMGFNEFCKEWATANSTTTRERRNEWKSKSKGNIWEQFPTQSPFRSRNDGFSRPLLRYLNQEIYDRISTTSEENRIQNLSEVWEEIQQEKIWEKIRRFYSLESKDILLQTMWLYQTGSIKQNELSPFSEIVSETVLSKLRKYGEFRRSPQGQELQKQRSEQLGDIMSYLPHEIPLAAKTFETAMSKFETWHRNESIKAYGNAIVPAVVYQIFKSINEYEKL